MHLALQETKAQAHKQRLSQESWKLVAELYQHATLTISGAQLQTPEVQKFRRYLNNSASLHPDAVCYLGHQCVAETWLTMPQLFSVKLMGAGGKT